MNFEEVVKNEIAKFNNINEAYDFSCKPGVLKFVIIGNDKDYWVVTTAEALRLQKHGHKVEVAVYGKDQVKVR